MSAMGRKQTFEAAPSELNPPGGTSGASDRRLSFLAFLRSLDSATAEAQLLILGRVQPGYCRLLGRAAQRVASIHSREVEAGGPLGDR